MRQDWAKGWRGVAETGRSKRQKRGTKMQRRSGFYIRRLPPVAYGSRPPSRRGATVTHAFGRSRSYRASVHRLCVILSGALCAKSNLEGVHRRGVAAPIAVTGSCRVTTKAERRHAARVRKQRGTRMRGLCVSTVAFTVSLQDPVSPHAAKRSDAHSAQSSTAPLRSALRMTQAFGFVCPFTQGRQR